MKLKFYPYVLLFALMGLSSQAFGQCEVGTMTTTGTVTITCDQNEEFDLATDGMETIPASGGFGWSFSDDLGGTGGLAGGFTLTNATNPASYDASVNGIMPANGLPNLSGLWVIKAVVYSDAGSPTATICSTSSDSLIVDFLGEAGPTIDDIVDNGDGSATVTASGGQMPYSYEWSDGQTTQTATGLSDGVYTVTVTGDNGCFVTGEVAVGNATTCEVGMLITTGETLVCSDDGTFDVATDETETIPAAGGFGWTFSDDLGGTGGLAGGFTLTNATNPATYNADINGVLSSNGLPPLDGLWVIKGVVYDDAGNATGSICSTTSDSLIVNFSSGTLNIVEVIDNGDGSATVTADGGTPPYTYEWSDGQMTQTATGLDDGNYSVTVTDADGCSVSGQISIGAATPCLDWVAPTPTTGYTNFNTLFGGAPCDDGTGCPFNEINTFEVWASEAYTVDGFQEGGTYTFSMCNGPGAGTWVPEFTIIAPSGEVDAFGEGDGDGCSITWTASESGTYLIVINEAGACGGGDNQMTNNGFPALTCTDGPEVACPEVPCEVGELDTSGETVVCTADGTFDLATDGNEVIPENGGFGWQFSDASGGTGGAAGGFTLTNATNPTTYDTDLNGVLSSNDLDPLGGIWVVYGVVYENSGSPNASICATTTDSLVIIFNEEMEASAVDNGDGSATVSVTGGSAPYSYEWSDGQTTETAVDLGGGTFTVTVTDALGCTVEAEVDVMSSVGEIEALTSLYLGPNPTSGHIDLQLELDSPEEIRLEVRNITGQLLDQSYFGKRANLNHEFNFSHMADGVYFVRIVAGADELTKRVILAK